MPSTPPPLEINIISDVVCPWCFVGKRNLEAALSQRPGLEVVVRWQPFLLDPNVPPEGHDATDYIRRKFGSSAYYRAMRTRIEQMGGEVGIQFAFGEITRRPSSIDAHRLIAWADDPRSQDTVVESLFARYFERGEDISDRGVLLEVAAEAGLDTTSIAENLATDLDKTRVLQEAFDATRIGVTGVPCFLLGGVSVIPGAQPIDVFLHVLDKVQRPTRPESTDSTSE